MRSARFTIFLPEPLADAIVGEAVRCSARTSEVIAEALRELFPVYVACRMRADLEGHEPRTDPK